MNLRTKNNRKNIISFILIENRTNVKKRRVSGWQKNLSPWCKEAKKKMIDMDLEVNELASSLGLTRPYVSSVLNGRVYSPVAVKKISDYLQIPDADSE